MTDPTPHAIDTGSPPGERGRRRVDRVLSAEFLAGLEQAPLDRLRAQRRIVEQEEADLSYVRRMLQGRMDIIRAELVRRSGGAASGDSIVEHLGRILADAPRRDHGSGRFLTVEPSRLGEHRRRGEQVITDIDVSDVEARSDEELQAAAAQLSEVEAEVSLERRKVQEVMDACTAEVGRRYRVGSANVADLLAER